MAAEPTNTNDNQDPTDDDASKGGDETITLETVVDVAPDELSDDQKTFLKDNVGELSDEQKETFKEVLEAEDEEEPEDIDPEKVEVQVRGKLAEKKEEEESEDDEEDEIDPEDKKNIRKVVGDELTDFRGKLSKVDEVENKQDVADFIADNPEFKIYRGVILKYMAHPAWKNVPVRSIVATVAFDDLQKLGAKKEREAAQKAKGTQDSGTTIRKPQTGKTDWQTASKEEFQKKKNEVLGIKV